MSYLFGPPCIIPACQVKSYVGVVTTVCLFALMIVLLIYCVLYLSLIHI